MAHIGIDEVILLKNEAESRFGAVIHLHDSCGGQSFSADAPMGDELIAYLTDFFAQRGMTVTVYTDRKSFTAK